MSRLRGNRGVGGAGGLARPVRGATWRQRMSARQNSLPAQALVDLSSALTVMASGAPDDIRIVPLNGGVPSQALERFAVLPRLSNPRVLLPLDAPVAALNAVLVQHEAGASSSLARTGARTLRMLSRLRLAPLLLRDRIAVTSLREDLSRTYLRRFLGEVLGREDFSISMRIAPSRPNGKPVIQAVSNDGTILAYAKFGWDDLTRQLVRHETTVLTELASLTEGLPLRVPRVLYRGECLGLEAGVLAPIQGRPLRVRSPSDMPILAAVAVANMRPRVRQNLCESIFWQQIVKDVVLVGPQLQEEDRCVVESACAKLEADWGQERLCFGQSHGDWIPPNMSIAADGTMNVWDWERSSTGVPVGVDSMQFLVYLALHRARFGRHSPDGLLRAGADALHRQGLRSGMAPLLLALTLLRSALWYGEARCSGRMQRGESRYVRLLEAILGLARSRGRPEG